MRNKTSQFFTGTMLSLMLILTGACGPQSAAAQNANEEAASLLGLLSARGVDDLAGATAEGTVSGTRADQSVFVKLMRVRYCTAYNFLGLCKIGHKVDRAGFEYWSWAGVGEGNREDTMLAEIWNPPASTVENLVFVAAGQQPPGNGVPNTLTGQPDNYKNNCARECWHQLDSRSLAHKIFQKWPIFNGYKTFFGVVFDTQFNYLTTYGEKNQMETAYYNYLTSKANPANLKKIYLVGSSRGGCLVMRLAKRLRNDPAWRNVPMLIHTIDGVCNELQGENGTTTNMVMNPLNYARIAWYMPTTSQYPYRTKFRMYQIVTGAHVVLPNVHGYSFFDGTLFGNNTQRDEGWRAQRWANLEHTEIGRDYAYSAQGVDVLNADLEAYNWNPTTNPVGPAVGVSAVGAIGRE